MVNKFNLLIYLNMHHFKLHLKATEIEKLKEAFLLFDKNDDGFITPRELGQFFNSFGKNPTETELNDVVNKLNVNNGAINFLEFVSIMTSQVTEDIEEIELKEAFKIIDKDGDGFISIQELRSLMTNLGEKISEKDLERIIKSIDCDGDMNINYEGKYLKI